MIYTDGMPKTLIFALICLTLNCLEPPKAAADAMSVKQRLQGMEWLFDPAEWQLDDQETITALGVIAGSKDEMSFLRGRALTVLTHMPGPGALRTFSELIESEANPILRRRAVDGYCLIAALGEIEAALLPVLAEDDRHLRLRAASCLSSHAHTSKAIQQALQTYERQADDWELRRAGMSSKSP